MNPADIRRSASHHAAPEREELDFVWSALILGTGIRLV
jgi:hypothetical protein